MTLPADFDKSQVDVFMPSRRTTISSQPVWITTFTDMIALMLTFFVLTYAMSEPRQEDWEEMTSKVQEEFNKFTGQRNFQGDYDTFSLDRVASEVALKPLYLQSLLNARLDQVNLGERPRLQYDPANRQLILSLPQALAFDSGKTSLSPQGQVVIDTLAPLLKRIKNSVELVGHTDIAPVIGDVNTAYASNWDLSLDRAMSVAKALRRAGYTKNMLVLGQASSEFDIYGDNLTPSEKMRMSRRVDIVINPDDGSRLKRLGIELVE
ncbi:MAG: flagellar motor protein MotB [Pseudobdellovibrionaceae bacterium]